MSDEWTRGVVVANAPISYGAFELTVGIDPAVPDVDRLLDLVVEAGYAGIDLGPAGYLGTGEVLAERLSSRGLGLAGGYLELPYADHGALELALVELGHLLDVFDGAAGVGPLAPKPTIAAAGADHRRKRPGRAGGDRAEGRDEAEWARAAEGIARAVALCRDRGYEPTFHPEVGTYVEAPWEVDRLLESCDVGLCLETGHMLLGGADVVEVVRRWGDRINHVHVKDAHRSVMQAMIADGVTADQIWHRRAFPALGQGDVPIDDVLDQLRAVGYQGWLVVEQDIFPGPGDPDAAQRDQLANREFLRARGL